MGPARQRDFIEGRISAILSETTKASWRWNSNLLCFYNTIVRFVLEYASQLSVVSQSQRGILAPAELYAIVSFVDTRFLIIKLCSAPSLISAGAPPQILLEEFTARPQVL